VPVQARQRRRRRPRRRARTRGPSGAKVGVTAEAGRALAYCQIRDYSVPNWYSGLYGVPGSLLKRKIRPFTSERDRARTLLVRLNYLIDFRIPGGNPIRKVPRPCEVIRSLDSASALLQGPNNHIFHGWRDLRSLRWELRLTLKEIVNLPLTALRRTARSLQGPLCSDSCNHESCLRVLKLREGRSPRKGSKVRISKRYTAITSQSGVRFYPYPRDGRDIRSQPRTEA